MNYTEMLNNLIASSGKMLKDIADECTEKYGVNLTRVYLSILKTQEGKIPSPEVSRAIAKACNAQYDNILVIQAYLDKAPKEITDFLQGVQSMLDNPPPLEEEDELSKQLKAEAEKPLAEFICGYAPQMDILKSGIAEKVEAEPNWIVIPPEQIKRLMLIKDSDMKKLVKE